MPMTVCKHPMRIFRSWLLLVLLAIAHGASAAEYYSASIEVPDRGEDALRVGARAGLEEVLIRVSGDRQVADNPAIKKSLADARSQLSLYSYREQGGEVLLEVQFDQVQVKQMLRNAGASFWVNDRPDALLWLVVDEPAGRRFASLTQEAVLLEALQLAFLRRGVRLRFPLLDLEDAAVISADVVWQRVVPRIQAASERYDANHVLVGRYVELTDGRHLVDWLHIGPEEQQTQQVAESEINALAMTGANLVVDAMASRYAVGLRATPTLNGLSVIVMGVSGLADYQQVLAIFRAIPVVESVHVSEVVADRLSLEIRGVADADALNRLLPTASALTVENTMTKDNVLMQWSPS